MPYITREDGERFVIPSYRDVLAAKNKNALKKEILLLSQSYGEYITLQRKNASQYEVTFSPDSGYLLGESIWHYFKKPNDMIYCEAIPNTTEALLVIVKNGSVYLDGSFPLDSIPEELIIFLTQQNNFEIYIYGDVPISQEPEEGKFNFETSSIKSFSILDQPAFPTLPLVKIYQLQLVDVVLKAHGIGAFPIKPILIGAVILAIGWYFWSYVTSEESVIPQILQSNPYQAYNDALTSPAPEQVIQEIVQDLAVFYSSPGWMPVKVTYTKGDITALMQSRGTKIEELFAWAKERKLDVDIKQDGIYVTIKSTLFSRSIPTKIYPINGVIAKFVDDLANVYPGNNVTLGTFVRTSAFTKVPITIKLDTVAPVVLSLIGEQLQGLPFVVQSVALDVMDGSLSGDINIEALGS